MRIEAGRLPVDCEEMPNWSVDADNGLRTSVYRVDFDDVYDEVPTVTVGLAGLDVVTQGNRVAVDSDVIAVDTAGFEVRLAARNDQRINRVALNWLAVGS